MSANLEANKILVKDYLRKVVSQGDDKALRECLAEDVIYTSRYTKTPVRGIEAYKNIMLDLRRGIPDLTIHVQECLAEGDLVAVRWICTGTQSGEFMGLSATGRQVRVMGMSFYRIAEGKIIEGWLNEDVLGIMEQIGIIPQ